MVEASGGGAASASRSFAPASVSGGGEVVVTITASDYGSAGRVTETLPAGFTYVSSNLSEGVRVTGQEVRFTLFGDASFTYTVTASSVVGSHSFSGVLRDFEQSEYTVGGAATVTVESSGAGGASASRSFAPASVSPGGQVVITISVSDYGSAGRVTETLPAGFTYVSSNLSEGVRVTGQEVRFTLFGDTSFTYTVTASSVVGSHAFSGVLRDFEQNAYTVGGASSGQGWDEVHTGHRRRRWWRRARWRRCQQQCPRLSGRCRCGTSRGRECCPWHPCGGPCDGLR